ncbi:MAG: hypothetical protein KC766_21175, partial [Myxococcales bacterium]|nr:hypothetical protein [Myxococcales bacterium]
MTYTLPEIAEPLSPEQQVLELQRLLAAVLGCDKSLASMKDAGYRITEASKRGLFPSVEGGRVGFSCGVAHGLEFRQGQLKDGAPITRTDLEKAQRWFRLAINDALEKVSPDIRAQALANPEHVLASTQPLAAIDAITDPEAKAKALLNRVHAVLWKLDRGAAPYAPEAGHITPTLRQRIERHASAVPGMNSTTVLEALAALEERI